MCFMAVCSCFASCCSHCCCSSLKDCRAKKGPASRIPYIFWMFLCSLFAVVMRYYGGKEIWKNDFLDMSLKACSGPKCAGNGAIYRTSMCLFIFFLIHAAAVRATMTFHWAFLGIKIISFIIVLIVTFWIPNEVFEGYAEFARAVSVVFLFVQIVVYLDWAWNTNDRVLAKIADFEAEEADPSADEDESKTNGQIAKCMQFLLFGSFIFMLALCIVAWSLFFVWFSHDGPGCEVNEFLVSFTMIAVIILYILSCYMPHGSVFATGIVSLYTTYLCYAGASKTYNHKCNSFSTKDQAVDWFGLIITLGAISYMGFSVSNKTANFGGGKKGSDETNGDVELAAGTAKSDDDGDGDGDDGSAAKDEDGGDTGKSNYDDVDEEIEHADGYVSPADIEKKHNVHFHLAMAFAAVYLAMILTDWSVLTETKDPSQKELKARAHWSKWVNIISQWIAFLLYSWTLMAPKLCPGRFGVETDDE